jgi:predicted histone-like DNA-binding protein
MAIKYKIIQRTQPGVSGGGVKKFYAQPACDDEVTVDELAKDIEKFSALSEPDVHSVLIAAENVITTHLSNGRKVRLSKLGTFSPAISSEGRDTEEEVTGHVIRRVGVNYRPGTRMLKALKDAGFKKLDQ